MFTNQHSLVRIYFLIHCKLSSRRRSDAFVCSLGHPLCSSGRCWLSQHLLLVHNRDNFHQTHSHPSHHPSMAQCSSGFVDQALAMCVQVILLAAIVSVGEVLAEDGASAAPRPLGGFNLL